MATRKSISKEENSTVAARTPRKRKAGKSPKATAATAARPAKRLTPVEPTKPVQARKAKTTATKAVTRRPKRVTAPQEEIVMAASSERPTAEAKAMVPQASIPSRAAIAARAAEIWRETGGAPFDNWIRAERELGA